MQPSAPLFTEFGPRAESNWRGIVLLGGNTQSYKFALASTLLDVAATGRTSARLDELALPFAQQLCEHLKLSDRQGTAPGSALLDACRRHNRGDMDLEELREVAISQAFRYVFNAFHNVERDPVPTRFFDVSGRTSSATATSQTPSVYKNGILHLTDDAMTLAAGPQGANLRHEVQARWRLVETAWELGVPTDRVVVTYDETDEAVYARGHRHRPPITGVREATSGYQKGRCFYCNRDIDIGAGSPLLADVDHVFPRKLQQGMGANSTNLDGLWNLVLACRECNRGAGGKFTRLPDKYFLRRLWERNEHYISSHHPLRETLMLQTGANRRKRKNFLDTVWTEAKSLGVSSNWRPPQVGESVWTDDE